MDDIINIWELNKTPKSESITLLFKKLEDASGNLVAVTDPPPDKGALPLKKQMIIPDLDYVGASSANADHIVTKGVFGKGSLLKKLAYVPRTRWFIKMLKDITGEVDTSGELEEKYSFDISAAGLLSSYCAAPAITRGGDELTHGTFVEAYVRPIPEVRDGEIPPDKPWFENKWLRWADLGKFGDEYNETKSFWTDTATAENAKNWLTDESLQFALSNRRKTVSQLAGDLTYVALGGIGLSSPKPARIKSVWDAYVYILHSIDLRSLIVEAIACRLKKYNISLDMLIELACDEMLKKALGDHAEEFLFFLESGENLIPGGVGEFIDVSPLDVIVELKTLQTSQTATGSDRLDSYLNTASKSNKRWLCETIVYWAAKAGPAGLNAAIKAY